MTQKPSESSVLLNVILFIITFGIYNLFWQYKQMKTVNIMLGEKHYSYLLWLLGVIITLGLFHIYHEYVLSRSIVKIQHLINYPVMSADLPLLSLVLTFFSFGLITDALQQHELNLMIQFLDRIPLDAPE